MRPTTYDAFWCARATAWLGLFLVVAGLVFSAKGNAIFALASFMPAVFAFAGAAIVHLWARHQRADEDARIIRTLDLIPTHDEPAAAQRLREIRDEMLADDAELPPETLEQQKRITMDEIMVAIRGQWKEREDETDG